MIAANNLCRSIIILVIIFIAVKLLHNVWHLIILALLSWVIWEYIKKEPEEIDVNKLMEVKNEKRR